MLKKVAIVTGSSKGIGQAIAMRLGIEGYYTYVTYHTDQKGGEKTVKKIEEGGGKASLLQLDVCSEQSVKQVFEKIENAHGHLNVLVCNAGIEIPNTVEEASFDDWKAVTETKINGSFLCTKYSLPLLKGADNSNVVYITSALGERPKPKYVAYGVGNAAVIAFTKAMAVYLCQFGIRTNALAPGQTRTSMWDEMGGDDEELWEKFASINPMGRVSTPNDLANAVMLIVNDSSKFLNGNFIYMNGGVHLT